jgi:ankyrin repeat protein
VYSSAHSEKNEIPLSDDRKGNWEKVRKLRALARNADDLALAIADDDVGRFQRIIVTNGVHGSYRFYPSVFGNWSECSMLAYAAEWRAMNCIKYMLMNDIEPSKDDFLLAIAAGDPEIVRLFDERLAREPETPSAHFFVEPAEEAPEDLWPLALQAAAVSHNNRIFQWILESKCSDQAVAIHVPSILETNNFEALFIAIGFGFDIPGWLRFVAGAKNTVQAIVASGYDRMLRVLDVFAHEPLLEILNYRPPKAPRHGRAKPGAEPVATLAGAAKSGRVSMLQFFVDLGVVFGGALLRQFIGTALANGHTDLLEWLVKLAGDGLVRSSLGEILAASSRSSTVSSIETLRHFVSKPLDLSQAIQAAILSFNFPVARYLLDLQMKEDPSICIGDVIGTAIEAGNLELCQGLAQYAADVRLHSVERAIRRAVQTGFGDGLKFIFGLLDEQQRRAACILAMPLAIKQKNLDLVSFLMPLAPSRGKVLIRAIQTESPALVQAILADESAPSFVNFLCPEGTPLTLAVATRNVDIVNLLLAVPGIDASLTTAQGDTPLITAARENRLAIVEVLLHFLGDAICPSDANRAFLTLFSQSQPALARASKRVVRPNEANKLLDTFLAIPGIDVNFCSNNKTPLLVAAASRNLALLEALLKCGNLDVNAYDESGATAFQLCVERQWREGVELLGADPRTDVNHRNFVNFSPLISAAAHYQADIFEWLMSCPRLTLDDSTIGLALVEALRHKQGDVFSRLFALDFDINARLTYTKTRHKIRRTNVFLFAVESGLKDPVKYILSHPRFDPKASLVHLGLFAAVKLANPSVLKLLLANVARAATCRNKRGESLLVYAIRRGPSAVRDVIVSLRGLSPTKLDLARATAAAIQVNADSVLGKLARMAGFDVNARCPNPIQNLRGLVPSGAGLPFIHVAARNDHIGALIALVKLRGVNVNARDANGRTILFDSKGYLKAVGQVLTEKKIDVNAQDFHGNTAFMDAILSGNLPFIRQIRRFQSDPKITNVSGQTLADLISNFLPAGQRPRTTDPTVCLRRLDDLLSGVHPPGRVDIESESEDEEGNEDDQQRAEVVSHLDCD